MAKLVKITYIRSSIGYSKRHKATMLALGLKKLHQTVEHEDTPALRGMLSLVNHLIDIKE